MSVLSVEQLLEALEDAQYLYPICRREATLPKFYS